MVKGDCWAESAINVIQLAAPGDLDLEIHKPAVIDPAEPMVVDEDGTGAMTFVNVDNDDRDNLYDINDNQVNAGPAPHKDNDLVKLKLKSRIPANGAALSRVKLEASAMANHIRFYRSADKSAGEYMPNTEIVLTQIQGGFRYEFIWVEGIVQHTAQRQTRIRLYCDSDPNCPNADDEVALTIVGIASLTWEGINNSENDNNVLTPETHPTAAPIPGAVKVFPDGRTAAEAPRNLVNLVVTLCVAPIEPLIVYVKSFDVDDPMDNGQANDPNYRLFLDPNDVLANAAGGNYAGTPAGTMTYTEHEDNRPANNKAGVFDGQNPLTKIASINFAVGITEMKHQFTVSMQPGDNYKAVAFMESSFLEHLENLDRRDILNVVDNTTLTPVAAAYVSNTLTVWRFLHVENRSMGDDVNGINKRSNVKFTDFESAANSFTSIDAFTTPVILQGVQFDYDVIAYYYGPPAAGVLGTDLSLHLNTLPPACIGQGRFEGGTADLNVFQAGTRTIRITANGERRINVATLGPGGVGAAGPVNLSGAFCTLRSIPVQGQPNLLTRLTVNNIQRVVLAGGGVNYIWSVVVVNGNPLADFVQNGVLRPSEISFPASDRVNVINIDLANNQITTNAFAITVISLADDDPPVNTLLPHYQLLNSVETAYSNVFLKTKEIRIAQLIGFDQNMNDNSPGDFLTLQNSQQTNESNNFWVVHVVSGWQGETNYDRDPNQFGPQGCQNQEVTTRVGWSDKVNVLGALEPIGTRANTQLIVSGCEFALIYRGVLNNEINGINPFEDVSTAHEIGHQFGLAHGEAGDPGGAIPELGQMGLMASGVGNNNTVIIPRYQNFIRSRITSPGR